MFSALWSDMMLIWAHRGWQRRLRLKNLTKKILYQSSWCHENKWAFKTVVCPFGSSGWPHIFNILAVFYSFYINLRSPWNCFWIFLKIFWKIFFSFLLKKRLAIWTSKIHTWLGPLLDTTILSLQEGSKSGQNSCQLMDLWWLINTSCVPYSAKQAKIKQNSKENQTKLTMLNPKKHKQFLQNSTKKSNKINTHKKTKQLIVLLNMGIKIFWKFYCAAYTYLPIPMKIFKMKFFLKTFVLRRPKKN